MRRASFRHVLTTLAEKYGSISMGIVWAGSGVRWGVVGTPPTYTIIIVIIDGRQKDVLKSGKRQRAPPCHNKVDEWRSSVVRQSTGVRQGQDRTRDLHVGRVLTAGTQDPRRRPPPSTEMKSGRRLVDANHTKYATIWGRSTGRLMRCVGDYLTSLYLFNIL